MPDVATVRVRVALSQGDLEAATRLVEEYDLPLSRARVHLARGEASPALALLRVACQQAVSLDRKDDQLKAMVLKVVAYEAQGYMDNALLLLADSLSIARPEGFIRIFVDGGIPMAAVLREAAVRRIMPVYVAKLLAAFATEGRRAEDSTYQRDCSSSQPLVEPLSSRELEVVHLIAEGLSNREIGERLFLALNTVKGHNRNRFGKLQVQRRTEAVARARELGIL
jgi:LuxR family maltose regulon positive regulatory protein